MSYLSVENFKFGLDTRKSQQTANPGTLVTGQDGHINQGGEFEVRKAFVLLGTLPRAIALSPPTVNGDTNGDTLNAYGLQPTSSGLLTFGSADSTRNTVPTGVPYVFPTGVTYQRLLHHLVAQEGVLVNVDGGTTASLALGAIVRPAMTGVTHSCSFSGKAFVLSTFGTGALGLLATSQMHYNGSPVNQFWYGHTWITVANYGAFSQFDLYFNAAQEVPGFSPNLVLDVNNSLLFYGPTTDSMLLAASDTDATSSLTAYNSIATSAAVAAISAKARFDISAWTTGAGTLTITDSLGTVVAAVAHNAGTSLATFVIAVVKAINLAGATTGYSATWSTIVNAAALNYRINVVAPATYGNVTTTLTLTDIAAGSATTLNNTAFSGGVNGITGNSAPAKTSFGAGAWTNGSHWTLVITSQGLSYTLGAGNIYGLTPTFCAAFGNRLHFLEGSTDHFSKIGDATRWEDQDTGAGDIAIVDRFSDPSNLVAISSYQGKLAYFGRNVIEIYNAPADPNLFSQSQVLQNIGALAKHSVKSMGDLDVLFLSDTGIRSVRVRDMSLNAFVSDIGSPIDDLVQTSLLSAGDNTLACGVVEPSSNRYWLYLKGVIYVLSYFPSSKIIAWSTYLPTYETLGAAIAANANYAASIITYAGLTIGNTYKLTFGANEVSAVCGADSLTATGYFTARAVTLTVTGNAAAALYTGALQLTTQNVFTPEKFEIYQGQVYVLTTDGKVLVYGGANNTTYDSVSPILETAWMDAGRAGTSKQGLAVDAIYSGGWDVYAGMDMKGATMDVTSKIGNSNAPNSGQDSTVEGFKYPFQGSGTHFKLKAVGRPGSISSRRTFSRFIFHFNMANEKT